MKIANIVYEKKLVNHDEVEYINYFNRPIRYEELKNLPTLYIGWSFMKLSNSNNQIISNCDILKNEIISNQLYWECSFDEGKSLHINGVEKFVNLVPFYYFTTKYQYISLDPIFFQLKTINDLIEVLPEKIDKLYNFKNNMIYFIKNNEIYGIDLEMFKFFKFLKEEIIEILINRTENMFNDLDGEMYQSYYKIFPNFQYLKRFLVVMI